MNLTEIVNRPITEPFTTQEISFCIQNYLKEAKGIDTVVDVESTIHTLPQQMHIMYMQSRLINILQAFDKSREYFKSNINK